MRFKIFFLQFILLVFLATSCTQVQETQKEPNFSFAFMTDIHVEPERHAIEGFRAAITKVNELNPNFVVTGGDLVMDVLGARYSRADSLYNIYTSMEKEFHMPVYNTIGNHEHFGWYASSGVDTTNDEYGDRMFEKRIGPRYQRIDAYGWVFFLLDSVVKDSTGYEGGIDTEQIAWLISQLDSIPAETPIVVSIHIPLLTLQAQIEEGATAANGPGDVIVNSREVTGLFEGHNLRFVLQGHLHYYETMHVFGTDYITGGAVSGAWWTGPYRGTEEGFVLLKVIGDNLTWEYIDYGWEARQ